MEWIEKAQAGLREAGLEGWLLYDFRGSNPIAQRFLPLGGLITRRVFCFVPATGTPVLMVHAIERGSLPDLPVEVRSYSSRVTLEEELRRLLPKGRVALEYSPRNDIPYLSHVDAGTIELLRDLGIEPVSSGDLLQAFSAWTPAQVEDHEEAAEHVGRARDLAFEAIAQRTASGEGIRETEVQRVITDYFESHGLVYGHPPIIGFGPHSGDPHYSPRPATDRKLQPGDAILVDLWAKKPGPRSPYADVTWMGSYGTPSPALARVWETVSRARDLAVERMAEAFRNGSHPQGREIDRAVREHISAAGYGEAFIHRTGHSLGSESTHGDAVHLDDFETRDTRRLLPGIAVTVEPGVYLEEFGVRSEIDVLLERDGPRVTTDRQTDLVVVPLAGEGSDG